MKHKHILNTSVALMSAIVLVMSFYGFAQNKNGKATKTISSKVLPFDPNVRTGKLANGFTYYIRHNTEPKNQVIFYLANKVGSILESDDQQGLAHFIEHMNFNGTQHFPKNEMVNYLQKAGVKFGADLNAYTGFDETVYQLPLPSDKPEIVKNGIEIMHDWAQSALLESTEIDRERGVILEEERLGKGAEDRMRKAYLPVLLNHSRYSQRLPIGVDTVLKHFKHETLRSFYRDWYRPNLQALIVVGDIDVDQMEATIKAKFADLKNPANEKPRVKYTVPLTGKNQFIALTDKEMSSTTIEVIIKHEGLTIKTADDYRKGIGRGLFNQMLGQRYQQLSTQDNPPFLAAGGSIGVLLGDMDSYNVNVRAKPDNLEDGFKAAWRETERLIQYGFTQTELDRVKKNYLNNLEQSLENKDKTGSTNYMNEYLIYFLRGEAAPGIEFEYQLAKEVMAEITLAEVNALTKEYIKSTDRDVVIKAPDKDKLTLPDEKKVNSWMDEVREEKIAPYVDDFMDKPILMNQPIAGKIIKELILDSLNATELTLSNGAKVILKKTDFANNDITFSAFSPGGTSLCSDADYQSALYAAYLTATSGLGEYNYEQYVKYVLDKRIGTYVYIDDYAEGMGGYARPESLEDLFQVVHVYFTQPKSDSVAFKNLILQNKASLANRGESPENVFEDTISSVMGNYNIRRTPPSLEKIGQLDQKRIYEIFSERFADASGFTFTFVGDFDLNQVKPLIEKYLGSLTATNSHEKAKDLGIYPPSGKITKTVYKGAEAKASVRLVLSGSYNYNAVDNKTMDALTETLQIRLLERLREEESGVYSPSANISYSKVPEQRFRLSVSFGCAPENVEMLIASVLDEIKKMKTDGPDEINVDKFKAEDRLKHEKQLRENYFWANYFQDQSLKNENLNEVFRYESILDKVTKNRIKEAANKYLREENLIRFMLLPEDTKK